MDKKGFTLIELLIAVGILAVLAVATIIVINPAEFFRQSRDTQRISDLRSIRGAIDLYLVRGALPLTLNGATCVSGGVTYPQWRASVPTGTTMSSDQQPFVNSATSPQVPVQVANPRVVTGGGWISVDFTAMSENSPLVKLPLDPLNSAPAGSALIGPIDLRGVFLGTASGAYFYAYQCQGLTYEINANMESVKYSNGGLHDVESKDGGTKGRFEDAIDPVGQSLPDTFIADRIYEVGNDPGLDL